MSTAAEFDTYTPRPRYECTRSGVYHIGIKTDKEGNTTETPPVWLSDPIRLIGSVQGWQRLQSYGLTILSGRAKRERLADYLQTEGENTPLYIGTPVS